MIDYNLYLTVTNGNCGRTDSIKFSAIPELITSFMQSSGLIWCAAEEWNFNPKKIEIICPNKWGKPCHVREYLISFASANEHSSFESTKRHFIITSEFPLQAPLALFSRKHEYVKHLLHFPNNKYESCDYKTQ